MFNLLLMLILLVVLLVILYFISLIRQIGSTCGFYAIAFSYLKLNMLKTDDIKIHDKASELFIDAMNDSIHSYVGEVFDINILEHIARTSGLDTKVVSSAQFFHNFNIKKSAYNGFKCFIVPIQDITPHFIVLFFDKFGNLRIWNPNNFIQDSKADLVYLKSRHDALVQDYNWSNYPDKISLSHNFGLVLLRNIQMLLLRPRYNAFIKTIIKKEADCRKNYSGYDKNVNLKGYILCVK